MIGDAEETGPDTITSRMPGQYFKLTPITPDPVDLHDKADESIKRHTLEVGATYIYKEGERERWQRIFIVAANRGGVVTGPCMEIGSWWTQVMVNPDIIKQMRLAVEKPNDLGVAGKAARG